MATTAKDLIDAALELIDESDTAEDYYTGYFGIVTQIAGDLVNLRMGLPKRVCEITPVTGHEPLPADIESIDQITAIKAGDYSINVFDVAVLPSETPALDLSAYAGRPVRIEYAPPFRPVTALTDEMIFSDEVARTVAPYGLAALLSATDVSKQEVTSYLEQKYLEQKMRWRQWSSRPPRRVVDVGRY